MKKILFILFIFVLNAKAQIPGYLGKRLLIGYSNYGMLGIRGPGPRNAAHADERSPTINVVQCLDLGYVLKKNRMFTLSGQYQRTGLAFNDGDPSGTFLSDFAGTDSYFPYGGYKYTGDFSKPAHLSTYNIAAGMKFYLNPFLAPVGKYQKLEFVFIIENLKYDKTKFAQADPTSSNYPDDIIQADYGDGEYFYRTIAFAYTFGKTRILSDKIYIDYGARAAFSPALNAINILSGEEFANSAQNVFRHECNLRIARSQILNIHIGIGFLAY